MIFNSSFKRSAINASCGVKMFKKDAMPAMYCICCVLSFDGSIFGTLGNVAILSSCALQDRKSNVSVRPAGKITRAFVYKRNKITFHLCNSN